MISHKRNTGIALDDDCFTNSEDRVLLAKLGYTISLEEYTELEKTSEVLDVYSYIEKVAGIPREVARAVDKKEAFSGEYLKDMDFEVPKGYEVKGDLVCPMEKEATADPAQTILITGHSGAGKSTLAKALAEKLKLPLHRVDAHPEFKEYVMNDKGHWRNSLTPGTEEYKHYTDIVNRANKDTLSNAAASSIIEGTQLGHLSPEELAKYKAHVLVGGDLDQSIEQRIQRAVAKAARKNRVLSPEDIEELKIKSKLVANYWEPGIEKFRKLPGVFKYNHTEHQIDPLVKRLQALLTKKAETTHELKSSNIKAVGYDKENKTLEVAFHSGGNYTYKDVPKSLFDRIRKVKSPGKFFHKHIKKKVEEYPYNKIEKKATTLSATKKLLRQMQAQGIKLVRTPEQVFNAQNAAALRDKGKSLQELRPDLTRKKLLNRAKWVLEDHAGAYDPNLQAVIIPRQKYTIHNPRRAEISANSPFSAMNVRLGHEPSTVPNTFSPRAGLFHEYGHAQHHLDDPKAFGKYRTSNPEALFAQERIANNNALLFMRQNNVPQSHIENYIHNTAPAYASYLKAFSRGPTKYYDPAIYYSPHSLDTSSWYTK